MVEGKKKAQFWFFTRVAFEVFVCLHIRTLGRLKAVKETPDAGNVSPLTRSSGAEEQVGQGRKSVGAIGKRPLWTPQCSLCHWDRNPLTVCTNWAAPSCYKRSRKVGEMKCHGWWYLFWPLSWVCSLQKSPVHEKIALAFSCKSHLHVLIFAFPLWVWLCQLELHLSNHCWEERQPEPKC